jgi:hypothetical protein
MATEISESYVNFLSSFFSLSDNASIQSPSTPFPDWLPSYCNSYTDAHYLANILASFADTSSDLNQVISEIAQGDQLGSFKSLLGNMRWKFGDLLAKAWKNGWFPVTPDGLILTRCIHRCQDFLHTRNLAVRYTD